MSYRLGGDVFRYDAFAPVPAPAAVPERERLRRAIYAARVAMLTDVLSAEGYDDVSGPLAAWLDAMTDGALAFLEEPT